jgi:hypothetical protein
LSVFLFLLPSLPPCYSPSISSFLLSWLISLMDRRTTFLLSITP